MSNEELVKQIREAGDQDNKLTLCLWDMNSGIIRTVCNKFKRYIEIEDALQECYEPFTKAIKDYDPDAGMTFGSYCYNRCLWHLQRYVEECGLLIRITGPRRALIRQYKKVCREYYQKYGTQPEDHYLCKELDISQDQLERLRKDELKISLISLDNPLTDNPDDGTIADMVRDDSRDIEEETMDTVYKAQRSRAVWAAVDSLRPQQGQAIRLYYKDGKTYAEVGEAMGVSRTRVQVMLAQGIRQLRTGKHYKVLREFVDMSATYSEGVRGSLDMFNRTWTSSTESAAMRELERQREQLIRMQQLRSDALAGLRWPTTEKSQFSYSAQ